MIKTIIFDIGGVVTKTDFKAIYSGFGIRIGISPDLVINYHKEKVEDLLLGNITIEQFWNDMRNAGGSSELNYESIWIEEGIKNREIDHKLLEILKKLRKNYIVQTLTNLTPSRLLIDERQDLYSNFDYAILSCREHMKKPNPDFYKLALEKANAKPEEAIFVDDKDMHTIPAEKLGIKTILYTYGDTDTLIKKLSKFGVK